MQRALLQGPWGKPCSSWSIKGGEGKEHGETGDSHWQSTSCPACAQRWASLSIPHLYQMLPSPAILHAQKDAMPCPGCTTISVGAHWHWSSCLPPIPSSPQPRPPSHTWEPQPHLLPPAHCCVWPGVRPGTWHVPNLRSKLLPSPTLPPHAIVWKEQGLWAPQTWSKAGSAPTG